MKEIFKKIYNRIFGENLKEHEKLIQNISENPHFAREKQLEEILELSCSDNEEKVVIGTIGLVTLCETRPDLTEEKAEKILDSSINNIKKNNESLKSGSILLFKYLPIPEEKADRYAEELMQMALERGKDDKSSSVFLFCLNQIADDYPEVMEKYDKEISDMMMSDNIVVKNTALLVSSTTLRRRPKSMKNCRNKLNKIIKEGKEPSSIIGAETYERLREIDENLVGDLDEELLNKAKSKNTIEFSRFD